MRNEEENIKRTLSREGVPVVLGYCGRCGVLRVCRPEARDDNCPACVRALAWMRGEVPDAPAEL